MRRQEDWDELESAFDDLLSGADLEERLARLPDEAARQTLRLLWVHHLQADGSDFLGRAPGVLAVPAFVEGQELSGRFVITQFLGSGGMGEVYLAEDRRLGGMVAVKTIKQFLVPQEGVRRRFLQEVRTARQVTHPQVCRIHDLFDEGETAYFTMEYLLGKTLTDALGQPPQPGLAVLYLRQIAEGLQAAHDQGILHGDLKPGNVIVTAARGAVITDFGMARVAADSGPETVRPWSLPGGSGQYMAPELAAGNAPTRLSDYFAFGRMGQEFMPKAQWWRAYCADEARERPASLQPALTALEPRNWRRYFLGAGLVTAGGVVAKLWRSSDAVMLPSGSLVLINGFQAAQALKPLARAARQLVIAGLESSARLRIVHDSDLFPALRQIAPGVALPAEGAILEKLLDASRAAFWIDTKLSAAAEKVSLDLLVRRRPDGLAVLQTAVHANGLSELAARAAGWLRESAGESAESAKASAAPNASLSSNPDAVARFAEATEYYNSAELRQAAPLFEEAVRLDPGFARAHAGLAMCFNSMRRHADAVASLETAMNAASGLPEREKSVIAANYYKLTEDPVRMVEEARKNASWHGQESQYQRLLAHALCWTGSPAEAIPFARRATELAPRSDMNWNELIVTLCEAGQFPEALTEFQRARESGATLPMLERGAGLAHLCLGEYSQAKAAFERMAGQPGRLIHGAGYLEGATEVALAAWRSDRIAARTQGSAAEEHEFAEHLAAGHYLLGQNSEAARELSGRPELPLCPVHARQVQAVVFWASRLGLAEIVEQGRLHLEAIQRRWPNGHTTGLLRFAEAVQARAKGELAAAERALTETLGSTFSVYAMAEAASLAAARGQLEVASERWRQLDNCRGHVLKLYFPGLVLFGWFGQMQTAVLRGDAALARACANRILGCWGRALPRAPFVVASRGVLAA
jgi:tetratricopeptide (TPR) repeat protein